MKSFCSAILLNSCTVTKLKFCYDFSVPGRTGRVVYDFLRSNISPYSRRTMSISVRLPTPEGPTKINGLFFNGVGLKGWKYSFA